MIIARRNLMAGKPLPYLRRVAYLESNSKEYIDTGIVPTFDDTIFCKFNLFDSGFRSSPFGCYTSITSDGVFVRVYSPVTKIEAAFVTNGMGTSGISFDNVVSADNEIELRHGRAVMNGVEKTALALSKEPSTHLFLFASNNNGTYQRLAHVRVYYFRVSRNGIDVINLIPVLDLSGRPAMYDEVSGQFFYNQGTGEFTWGELDAASSAFSTEGGGTKCLTPRRSYRRSLRPSARFYSRSTSQRWEVAA